uniref:Uncharacterized protein n=1 Tax=Oryza rufipogon TaxID=4529 RepID=A0A0E0R8G4_ORYRU
MVTPEVEQYVCMDKAVYVAAYCHRPLLPGSYCGSKLVDRSRYRTDSKDTWMRTTKEVKHIRVDNPVTALELT